MTDLVAFRPLQTVSLPREAARVHLAEQLTKKTQLAPTYANLIARAVVDPTSLRHQLEYPVIKRLPDGYALMLETELFAPAISASPFNPRDLESDILPIALQSGEETYPPVQVTDASNGDPALRVIVRDRAHMEHVLTTKADTLRGRIELRTSIEANGVMEPITVIITEMYHRDSGDTVPALVSVDGSTRITLAQMLAGFDPIEVVYRWPDAPLREWRGRMNQILAVQQLPMDQATASQIAAHRALIVPARILVRVVPANPNASLSVVTAYRSIVGSIHIDRPLEWPKGSRYDELANAALDRMLMDGRLSPDQRAYFAGEIPPQDLALHGFQPHLDIRAALVANILFDRHNKASLDAAYRTITAKPTLGQEDRRLLIAELMMRSFRVRLSEDERDGVRSILERTIKLEEWGNRPWQVTTRTPDELLNAAIDELRSGSAGTGPSVLELGMLGTYWLIARRAMRRDTRGSKDNREGTKIIGAMLRTEQGLRQLHRAIIDGRNSYADAGGRPLIRAVKPDGQFDLAPTGQPLTVDDYWLRSTFTTDNVVINPSDSIEQRRETAYKLFRAKVSELDEFTQSIDRLMSSRGLTPELAREYQNKLNHITERVVTWAAIYKARQSQARMPFDGEDEDIVAEEVAE